MKNRKIWIVGVIVLLLVSGLVMTSCQRCPDDSCGSAGVNVGGYCNNWNCSRVIAARYDRPTTPLCDC